MHRTAIAVVLGVLGILVSQGQAGSPKKFCFPFFSPQSARCGVSAPSEKVATKPCNAKRSRWRCLRDWVCYRTLEKPVKCESAPCCRLPLYAFFLHGCSCDTEFYAGEVIPIEFSYTSLLNGRCAPTQHRTCPGCK